jgi:hypothetical protein
MYDFLLVDLGAVGEGARGFIHSPKWRQLFFFASYLSELALQRWELVGRYPPSVLAAAVVHLAVEATRYDQVLPLPALLRCKSFAGALPEAALPEAEYLDADDAAAAAAAASPPPMHDGMDQDDSDAEEAPVDPNGLLRRCADDVYAWLTAKEMDQCEAEIVDEDNPGAEPTVVTLHGWSAYYHEHVFLKDEDLIENGESYAAKIENKYSAINEEEANRIPDQFVNHIPIRPPGVVS